MKVAKEKERQERQRIKLEAREKREAEKQAKMEERKRKEEERRLMKEKEEREKQERKEKRELERKRRQEVIQYVYGSGCGPNISGVWSYKPLIALREKQNLKKQKELELIQAKEEEVCGALGRSCGCIWPHSRTAWVLGNIQECNLHYMIV